MRKVLEGQIDVIVWVRGLGLLTVVSFLSASSTDTQQLNQTCHPLLPITAVERNRFRK